MLERFLTDNLTKHFGQFVQGLDADQVRLSAWKGEIHLQNLQIRRHALDSLFSTTTKQAPVEIAYGCVGNLQVSIPWALVRSQFTWRSRKQNNNATTTTTTAEAKSPVSIVLTDVNLLITPRRYDPTLTENGTDKDAEETKQEEQDDNDARAAQIQDALDAELLKRVAESSAQEKKSWIQDRLKALLENLSVTVRNIHIRYEDSGHAMGFQWMTDASQALAGIPMQGRYAMPIHQYRPAFCVGITLQEFSIKATDPIVINDSDKKKQGDETANTPMDTATLSRKIRVASAEALAVYWDSDTPIMSEVAVQKQALRAEFFETAFATLHSGEKKRGWSPKGGFAPEHSFVLDPFSPSITVSLAQNSSSSLDASTVQPSTLEGNLPPCRFAVSRNLLEDLGYLRKSYAIWHQSNTGHISEATLRQVAALRPTKSPLRDPRGWWHYVSQAVIVMNREETARDDTKGKGPRSKRVRSGWLGVARLLSLRKVYIAAYEELVQATTNEERSSANDRLVDVENELDVSEVVAFRIHAYSWLRDRGVVKVAMVVDETTTKAASRWSWGGPSPRSLSTVEDDTKVSTIP